MLASAHPLAYTSVYMERLTYSHVSGEKSHQAACPFSDSDAEREIVLSTNNAYLREMRINPLAPASNFRRITSPGERPGEGERFIPWFDPDDELATAVTLRKEIFLANQDQVFYPGKKKRRAAVRTAAQQLLELQSDYLVEHFPDQYGFEEDAEYGRLIVNKTTDDKFCVHPSKNDWHPLVICGLLGQDDICVVERQDDGRQVFVAGFLATPTNWNLSGFVNRDMDDIHVNVGGYHTPTTGSKTRLKDVVDRSLETLPEYPVRQIARNNIFLSRDPSLSQDPQRSTSFTPDRMRNPGNQIFLRSERESLTRLPATEQYPDNDRFIIFTIKPNVFSLEQVAYERREEFASALRTNDVLRTNKKLAKKALDYLDSFALHQD